MFLMNLVKNYEEWKGKITEQTKITIVVVFTYQSSDPISRYYHSYCKHMLIKQKPWRG